MFPEREPPFGSGAPVPAARPSIAATTGMSSASDPRSFAHSPPTTSQLPSFTPSASRSHATAPHQLHSALQPPPPMYSSGALRPSAATSYRVPWTRHASSSGSNSNSNSGSNSSGGSFSANSHMSGSSSPRYSDLIDVINEAGVGAARWPGSADGGEDGARRRPQQQRPGRATTGRVLPVDHAGPENSFATNGSAEYGSPEEARDSSGNSPMPSPSERERASADSSAESSPSSYPLAPRKQSGDANDAAAEAEEPANPPKKRVRYLRDTDRRNIIRRIENGEKQAALAREFGVTRAAICHIKKNRYEIISRYDLLVKTAKEMDKQESYGIPPGGEVMVHEVRSKAVLLLLTTLRDRRSPPSTFRRTAGRLIMILLEEAFASLETEAVRVTTTAGRAYDGLQTKHQLCGVGIGSEGLPFLVLLNQMDPNAPRGSLKIESTGVYRGGQRGTRVDAVDLPPNVAQLKVFLFISTCNTGVSVCKAIEILCDAGVEEHDISVVMIWCAADGLAFVCNRFPRVRVITAAIDCKTGEREPEGLGDFVSRYNDRIDQERPDSSMMY